MTSVPPWDDRARDADVLAYRKRNQPARLLNDQRIDPTSGRGPVTAADLARREAADAYFAKAANYGAQHQNRIATPRPTKSGRWVAKTFHKGRHFHRTFDTYDEAAAYIEQIKES